MLLLTQYYPPEPGAASIRLQAMAQQLVARGWTVKVVTAFPHHLGHHNPRHPAASLRSQMKNAP